MNQPESIGRAETVRGEQCPHTVLEGYKAHAVMSTSPEVVCDARSEEDHSLQRALFVIELTSVCTGWTDGRVPPFYLIPHCKAEGSRYFKTSFWRFFTFH